MPTHDLVIVGSGPAGTAAALYARRQLLDVLVLEKASYGGQPLLTMEIENYPGIPKVNGYDLMESMRKQAEDAGARFNTAEVKHVYKRPDGAFSIATHDGPTTSRMVIWASGSAPRQAGFDGETRFTGRGVSYCATCDAMFYRKKLVFVCGGGSTAAEEALVLSRFASKVVLLVRKDHMRAQKSLQQKLQDADNVELRYNTRILSLAGDELPSSITIQNTANGETYKETYDEGSFGVFVFVGMQPQNDAVAELVQLDASGHIITDELMQTSTTGLYAAGDCRAKYLRQIVTATSDGAIAASRAAEYLTSL